MPEPLKPWEKHPALTAERLSEIATTLRDSRDDALKTYEPHKGETTWSLGCAKYERSKFCIQETAKANPTWMTIVPEKAPLRCTFAIEGIAVRFYHETEEGAPAKYTSSTDGEDRLYQMLLEADGIPFIKTLFRLAIKDDANGKVNCVSLVEFAKSGALINTYPIPFTVVSGSVIPLQSKPLNLDAIKLEPQESERQDDKIGNDEKDDSGTGTE